MNAKPDTGPEFIIYKGPSMGSTEQMLGRLSKQLHEGHIVVVNDDPKRGGGIILFIAGFVAGVLLALTAVALSAKA